MGLIDSKATIRTSGEGSVLFEERAVDMNLVLPDYYPPIAAVLKCLMIPCISSRSQNGDRYTVDGTTTVRLLYVSEDRETVHCYDATQPFNVSFRSEHAIHHFTDMKVDYVNCRATAPRRVDVHGAFRVIFEGVGLCDTTVFVDPCQTDLRCLLRPVTYTVPAYEAEKMITVDEAVDLGVRVERMLYSDVTVLSCECKVLTNKLIAKGVLRVKAVCVQNEGITTAFQDVPFSQILDADGLKDDWSCALEVMVGENNTYIQQNEGSGALLFVNCKLILCARLLMEERENLVTDAYHLHHPLVCETTPVALTNCSAFKTFQTSLAQSVSCPEHVTDVMDAWGNVQSCEMSDDGGQTVCNVCLLVCVIAKGEEGHPIYFERALDAVIPMDTDSCHPKITVTAISVNRINDSLRVQTDLSVESCVIQSEHIATVCNAVCDDAETFDTTKASVRIVYACEGDSLWDIGKKHHACVRDIMAENDLNMDVLSRSTMLMIPMP